MPYCDEAEFYDNDNGFVKVAEYRNGELLTIGSRCPLWLRELQTYLKNEEAPRGTAHRPFPTILYAVHQQI